VVLWDPSSGEWIRLRGGSGSPLISPSQCSAPLELRPSIIGATQLLNRCHPPISTHQSRPTPDAAKHPNTHPIGATHQFTDTPERVVSWDPSSGEWIRLRGGSGSPLISPSQCSAPLELRPSIIGATHQSNRCHPPICDPPIYGYTRKGGFMGSIERGVDSLAWGGIG
jgi:hypothetical protein